MEGRKVLNWKRQAFEFLCLHGWSQDRDNPFNPEIWCHPLFPLGELIDDSVKFCEEFYGEAWKAYESYIKGLVVFSSEEERRVGSRREDYE